MDVVDVVSPAPVEVRAARAETLIGAGSLNAAAIIHSVADAIGESSLGERARYQLDVARRDPRRDRGRGAMVADFFIAIEEAERSREMTSWGLRELARALEQEERRLGVRRDDEDLSPGDRQHLQAAWERAAMAQAEIDNGYPFAHAATLIAMYGALDALVEELVPGAQQIIALSFFESVQDRFTDEQRSIWEGVSVERRETLQSAIIDVIAQQLPQTPKRPSGKGADRYESVLARANLQTPPERPIPEDLGEALAELGALRDVFVHRGGRVDAKALTDAPTLRWKDGEFVRLGREDYRRYSAAVRAYGIDIAQRIIPPNDRRDLKDWRQHAYITA